LKRGIVFSFYCIASNRGKFLKLLFRSCETDPRLLWRSVHLLIDRFVDESLR